MPDDQNLTQNPTPKENSIPASPQEPTADAPIPPIDSEPIEAPSEAPEAPRDGFSDESNNIPPSNSTLTEAENEPKTEEKQALNEPHPEPVSKPVESPKPQTAQIPVNEPLGEPIQTKAEATPPLVIQTSRNRILELLNKAKNAIQFRKRKKLDRILTLFAKRTKITNDEVEKFLHVSDATAERYLNILEKENKIKQVGKTGRSVSYSKI